jgi:NhaP-type Na+/H+ or K+/H+ antiporter
MELTIWYVLVGGLLVLMAVSGSFVQRLPLSMGLVYLAVGFALGPSGAGLLDLNPLLHPHVLEVLTEVAVLLSLFSAGLKLRLPWRDRAWIPPLRLAFGGMILTVGLIAGTGVLWLGLPVGVAILLGGILAPTDPVLASDVTVAKPGDQDTLRVTLTGEAGLNDGTAFPVIMLGLGLLGLHEIGTMGWRWLAIDLLWAIPGGLVVGAGLGYLIGRLILYLRQHHQEAVGLDEFLALGLIALAYGGALLLHTYGFLAVFAAGLALRHIELAEQQDAPLPAAELESDADGQKDLAVHPEKAPAYLAHATLAFNEQIERLSTVLLMVVVGGLLNPANLPTAAIWFVPLLLLVIRPLAAWIALLGTATSVLQRGIIAWFGIRGIGSLYYLSYSLTHGLAEPYASVLTGLTLAVVAVSVIVHGISVTPLVERYEQVKDGRKQKALGTAD